jgi:hypothetical protein
MIVVVTEDGTVEVVDTVEDAQRYEAIDVENQVFVFYDEDGGCLRPRFTQPNRYRLFGLILEQGAYVLEPSVELDPEVDPLPLALAEAHSLKPNEHFPDLASTQRHFGSPALPRVG